MLILTDIESCITFLKLSNDAFSDSGECSFTPRRGRKKTLSPVTNIHQTIIQMESKVIPFILRSFLSPNEYLGFKPRLSLLRRSSDPGSRRQSDTNEASSLTNNHYFFSGEEGENNQMIHLSPSRLLFCSRAQPGRGSALQHHHAVLLRPEQLSSL